MLSDEKNCTQLSKDVQKILGGKVDLIKIQQLKSGPACDITIAIENDKFARGATLFGAKGNAYTVLLNYGKGDLPSVESWLGILNSWKN